MSPAGGADRAPTLLKAEYPAMPPLRKHVLPVSRSTTRAVLLRAEEGEGHSEGPPGPLS